MKNSTIILLVSLVLIGLFAAEIQEVVGAFTFPWSRKRTTYPCSDTDGLSITTQGTVTYRGSTSVDKCTDSQTVLEYYCTSSGMRSRPITCPTGTTCQDGACKSATSGSSGSGSSAPISTAQCTDSDGLNLGVKGTVISSGKTYEDKCGVIVDGVSMPNRLIEHYCGISGWLHGEFDCPQDYECKDGACIKSSTSTGGEPRPIPSGINFSTVNIEYIDDADLSDVGLSSAQKAVYIHSSNINKFNLKGTITASTSEVWLVPQSNIIKVYYRDKESIPDIKYAGYNMHISIADSAGSSIEWRFTIPNSELLVYTENIEDIYAVDSFFKILNGEIVALGKIASLPEADELKYKNYEIGTRTTDFYTNIGIIVRKPATYGASDTVNIKIPSRKY